MKSYTIDFEPVGRRGQCPCGKSLLDSARQFGVGIIRICGGTGKCHSCKIQVLKGTVSEPTSSEREVFSWQELKDGWRLACQTYPTSDCKLSIPPSSMTTPQRTQVEGLGIALHPEPAVHSYHVEVPPPSLSDLRADADRILAALNQQHQLHCDKIDIDVLRKLSPQLRSWNWQCQASVRNDEVIVLNPWTRRQLGLAVDLGTTKIAGYLVDLSNGRTLAAKGIMNPQISYGEDIISRITHVIESPTESARLKSLVTEALNQLAVDLCGSIKAEAEEIVDMVVVGNTAMYHLLLELPVKALAYAPFSPHEEGLGWESEYKPPLEADTDSNHILRSHIRSRALWRHHAEWERQLALAWSLVTQLREMSTRQFPLIRKGGAVGIWTNYIGTALLAAFEGLCRNRRVGMNYKIPENRLGVAAGDFKIDTGAATEKQRKAIQKKHSGLVMYIAEQQAMKQLVDCWHEIVALEGHMTQLVSKILKSRDILYPCRFCRISVYRAFLNF